MGFRIPIPVHFARVTDNCSILGSLGHPMWLSTNAKVLLEYELNNGACELPTDDFHADLAE